MSSTRPWKTPRALIVSYYKVRCYGNLQIGDKTQFKRKNLVICEKKCYLEKEIWTFEYTLARPSYLAMLRQYNEKICGMSILGTVLETAGETLKIHLDIDPAQDPAKAYPYDWIPGTGNLMYLIPKVGTRVSLYFYGSDERSARAIGCIRTNGGDQQYRYPVAHTDARRRRDHHPEPQQIEHPG